MIIIRNWMPYLYFSSALFITIGGLVNLSILSPVTLLNSLGFYDRTLANILFIMGIIFIVFCLVCWKIFNLGNMIDTPLTDAKEAQFFSRTKVQTLLQEFWKHRKKLLKTLPISTIISLFIIHVVNEELASRLSFLLAFIAVLIYSFIRIIIFEDFEERADAHDPLQKLTWWHRIIDYRSQPISISLVSFILIIFSYHTFDYYDCRLEYAPFYTAKGGSLFELVSVLVLPIFLSAFLYISHNYDFFGFRRVHPSKNMVSLVHFVDLGAAGLAFFYWIFLMLIRLLE